MTKITRSGLEYLAFTQAAVQWGRGAICVMREHQNKPAILRIENQRAFREWVGCFSLIHG